MIIFSLQNEKAKKTKTKLKPIYVDNEKDE